MPTPSLRTTSREARPTRAWPRQLPYVLLILVAVVGLLLLFPHYSVTLRRFLALPDPPPAALTVTSAEAWAQEVLRTGHSLVYYIWVVGAVLVGAFMAIAYYFFTWWNQHREMIGAIGTWQAALQRSEQLVVEAAGRLPVDVWLDFRDPTVLARFQQAIESLLPTIAPEEIDFQIANTSILIDVPADVFRRLGNYFRFRAELARQRGIEDLRVRDLWFAIRRYQRARELAPGGAGRSTFAHASHGIAICLVLLGRHRDAEPYAKDAADVLRAALSATDSVPPLVTYALVLKRLEKFELSIEAFETALSRAPASVYGKYNLACCYARWGDVAGSDEVRRGRHTRAVQVLENLVGQLGTEPHIVTAIHEDGDFEGLRSQRSELRHRFEAAAQALKPPA